MKNTLNTICFIILTMGLFSCEKMMMDTKSEPTKEGVLESMWTLVDQKYSYIEYKNINWDSIRVASRAKLTPTTTSKELFNIMSDMLYELKDGHVNLFSGVDYSRNWDWYLDSPENFNYEVIERNYLGKDYWISGGIKNTPLDQGKYGYMYYSSFSNSVKYIGVVLERFKNSKGIIIDIRNNGGGSLENAHILADHLADKRRLTYKMFYKDGTGHNDFSKVYEHYSTPKSSIYTKPVVVLTNRSCYSASSFFVTMVKEFPNVTILGDSTGGGAGLPIDYLLPNGWQMRLSSSRTMDARGIDFEYGVAPDVRHDVDVYLQIAGTDSMIELAKKLIDQKSIPQQ